MPTYEYECRKCGNRFEKFQSISAAPVKTCPECKGRVARVVSGGAGVLPDGLQDDGGGGRRAEEAGIRRGGRCEGGRRDKGNG